MKLGKLSTIGIVSLVLSNLAMATLHQSPRHANTHASAAPLTKDEPTTKYAQKNDAVLAKIEQAQTPWGANGPKLSGLLQTDFAYYQSSITPMGSGEEIRRLKLIVSGNVAPYWGYVMQADFAGNAVLVDDAYLLYRGFDPLSIRVGYMKEPWSLEHLIDDHDLSFLERSLPVNTFIPSRRIGIKLNYYGNLPYRAHSYTLGTMVGGVATSHAHTTNYDEAYELTARASYAYYPSPQQLLHLGIWGSVRTPDANHNVSFSSTPESDITSINFVNTGTINNVNRYAQYGVEGIGQWKSLALQAEYMSVALYRPDVNAAQQPTAHFNGWDLIASWFITGEAKPYDCKAGITKAVNPLHSYGAVEVAARYTDVNLNAPFAMKASSILGGHERNASLGVNWYVNNHVRFMLDYIKVHANQAGLVNTPRIVTARAQIFFD